MSSHHPFWRFFSGGPKDDPVPVITVEDPVFLEVYGFKPPVGLLYDRALRDQWKRARDKWRNGKVVEPLREYKEFGFSRVIEYFLDDYPPRRVFFPGYWDNVLDSRFELDWKAYAGYPGLVVPRLQVRAIRDGAHFENLHPWVPVSYKNENEANKV